MCRDLTESKLDFENAIDVSTQGNTSQRLQHSKYSRATMYTEWRLTGNGAGNQQNDENQPPPMPSSMGSFSLSPSPNTIPGARHSHAVNSPIESHANMDTRPFSDHTHHIPCSQPHQQPLGHVQHANGVPFDASLPEVDVTVTKARQVPEAPCTSGARSKSGSYNRRKLGSSDDEIVKLSGKGKRAAGLKNSKVKGENGRGLTEDDKLKATSYITDEKIWKGFRLKQMSVFIHVCV